MKSFYFIRSGTVDVPPYETGRNATESIPSIFEAAGKIIQVIDQHPFGGLLFALLVIAVIHAAGSKPTK